MFSAHVIPILATFALFAINQPTQAQTNWGTAISFNGEDDYVALPSGVWFDEGGGTNALDATGHGFNGRLINRPTWTHFTERLTPIVLTR
jgi:hypothetical protein